MAYAYDRLRQAMGATEAPQPAQANIFAADAQPAPQQAAGSSPDVLQSSSEGEMTPGPSSGGGVPRAPTTTPGSVSSSKVYAANTGAGKGTRSPVDFAKLTAAIGSSKEAAQNEANTYVSSEATAPYSGAGGAPDDMRGFRADVDKFGKYDAASGVSAAPAEMPAWQRLYLEGPGQAKAFDSTANTEFRDVDELRTEAGVGNLLRRRGDAEYSAGEASFDQGLLRRDANFQRQRQAAIDSQRDLQSTVQGLESGQQKTAQDQRQGNYDAWKASVGNYLSGLASGYRDEAVAGEKAYDAGLGAPPTDYANTQAAGVLSELGADPRYAELAPYLSLEGVDAGKYVRGGEDPSTTSVSQFFDPQKAVYFNRILDLLGRGGERAEGAGIGSLRGKQGRGTSYDRESLINELLAGAQGRRPAPTAPPPTGTGETTPPVEPGAGAPTPPGTGVGTTRPVPPGSIAISVDEDGNPVERLPNLEGVPMPAPTGGMPAPIPGRVAVTDSDPNSGGPQSGPRAPGDSAPVGRDAMTGLPGQAGDALKGALDRLTRRPGDTGTNPIVDALGGGIDAAAGMAGRGLGAIYDAGDRAGLAVDDARAAAAKQLSVPLEDQATKALSPVNKAMAPAEQKFGEVAKAGGQGALREVEQAAGKVGSAKAATNKLKPADTAKAFAANPAGALKQLLTDGRDSKFYGGGAAGDPRNQPGFWQSIEQAGYDTSTVNDLITAALQGKGTKDVDAALKNALDVATKASSAKAAKASAAAKAAADAKAKQAAEAAAAAKAKAAKAAEEQAAKARAEAAKAPAAANQAFSNLLAAVKGGAGQATQAAKDAGGKVSSAGKQALKKIGVR